MKPNKRKKTVKVIKAWAVYLPEARGFAMKLTLSGGAAVMSVWTKKSHADAHAAKYPEQMTFVVPCTISFELPKK